MLMTLTTQSETRRRKTEVLTEEEHAALKAKVAEFLTKQDALEALGFKNIGTMNTLLLKGSASPETIAIARKALAADKETH